MNQKNFYTVIFALGILALVVSGLALLSAARAYAALPSGIPDSPSVVDMPTISGSTAGLTKKSSSRTSSAESGKALSPDITSDISSASVPETDSGSVSVEDTVPQSAPQDQVSVTSSADTEAAASPEIPDISGYTLKLEGNTLYILDAKGSTVYSRDIPADKLREDDRRRLSEGITFSDPSSATEALWDLLT
ncbi:MAG: hypothetical protein MJ102_04365 [Clostridia bacterium]|nr:hypothetical protein [Clostridia bacterium]